MPDVNDMALVSEYAERKSEAAFAELVQRHINMVYSVAWRFTGNATDAQDVTQTVFVMLAQKAAGLRRGTILTGWLYETTRFTAMNLLRSKARQQAREQEAYMESTLNEANPDRVWQQLAPLLEEAMTRLSEKERTLLALRFFENKSGAETAAILGIQEWAAHKRVRRVVEKLRAFFAKRGVSSTGEAITEAISTHSVQAAPVALAKTITAIALTKGAAAGGSTLALMKGTLKLMAWTKTKTTVVTGLVILLTAGVTAVAVKAIRHHMQPNIQGAWEGVINTGGNSLRVVLNVSGANGSYHANIDSIDQYAKAIPINKFDYDYHSLRFESDAVKGSFEGKINSMANEMSGTWKQPGLDTTLVLKRTATPDVVHQFLTESDYTPRAGSDLQGYWKGALDVAGTKLHCAFKISEPADGQFVAVMASMDQGANNLVVSALTYDKPAVRIEVGVIGGVFEGTLNSDGTEISGTWTQAGNPVPLTVTRANPKAEQAQAAAQDANMDYSHTGENDLTGHWKGALDISGIQLHLALHVGKRPNGKLAGSLDSIDQGATGIPATVVRFTKSKAHLEWKMIGGVFNGGTIKNGKLTGKWQQGGQTLPLVFERSED